MKESEKPTFFNGDEHPSKDDEEIDFGYLEDFFPSADDGKISPAEKITSVAPGGSGWAGSGLRVGQNVVCRIIEVTEGGYNVILLEHHNLPGFVQESSLHQPGGRYFGSVRLCVRWESPLHDASYSPVIYQLIFWQISGWDGSMLGCLFNSRFFYTHGSVNV